MIRKIVIPVRGDGKGDNVLAHAVALAKCCDAHVVVTHCRPRPEDMIPYGIPVPGFLKEQIAEQATKVADSEEAKLREELTELAEKLGVRITDKPDGTGFSVSYVEEAGKQVDVIKHHGRLADLIAVAKPDVDRNLGANTLKAALFNTGRPVMMCPPAETLPEILGKHVAIAWNGSTEAARAVALTLDLIGKAEKVTVLSAGDEIHGASSDDLIAYLELRGISADLDRFTAKDAIGVELLKRSKAAGADLMIMGAYGDSHETETLFGGNTQTVVDSADMPVVFVH